MNLIEKDKIAKAIAELSKLLDADVEEIIECIERRIISKKEAIELIEYFNR